MEGQTPWLRKNKVALLLESAKCNISHGDRLSPGDKKRIARDIASTDPECNWSESALAEKLGVIQQTVNPWISDIRARQKAGRNTFILRLSLLGWTQEMISETVGMTQGRVAQIINNTNFGEINNLLSQGHDMEYIARHYNMDLDVKGDVGSKTTWQYNLRRIRTFCLSPLFFVRVPQHYLSIIIPIGTSRNFILLKIMSLRP